MARRKKEDDQTSMRDDFDAAINAIENDDEGAITTETAADAADAEAEITAEDIFKDEEGEEAEAKTKVEAEAAEISGKKSDPKDTGTDDVIVGDGEVDKADDAGEVVDLEKAPESWPPAAREGWKDLPETTRTQIAKREREIGLALEDGKENRKTGERFVDVTQRYANIIAAEGVTDPVSGFEAMMKVLTVFRTGTPDQKALKMVEFINGYNIEVNLLDKILSQSMGAKPTEDDKITQLLDERMKPVNSLLEQIEQNKRTSNFNRNKKAIEEVTAFKAANEFYNDVASDMADMVEMAEKRGVVMPYREAYDKACAMNPEVSKILAGRAADAEIMGNTNDMAKKREAASSIMGKQGGDGSSKEAQSMRDTINDAWDAQTG